MFGVAAVVAAGGLESRGVATRKGSGLNLCPSFFFSCSMARMKYLILSAALCLLTVNTPAQTATEQKKQADEFVRLTDEYKKSLADLLPYQEREVQRAEEKLTKLRELRKERLVEQRDVDAAEKALADARAKVAETQRQIKVADAQIIAALKGQPVPTDANKPDGPTAPKNLTAPKNQCVMKAEELPEVRGFKIGQASDEAQMRFPDKFRGEQSDEINLQRIYLSFPTFTKDDQEFEGVQRVILIYLDKKLASFEISYSYDTEWKSDLDFAASIAQALKLPTTGWRGLHPTRLDCADFTVTADALVAGKMKIELLGLGKELERRRTELNDKKRGKFKP